MIAEKLNFSHSSWNNAWFTWNHSTVQNSIRSLHTTLSNKIQELRIFRLGPNKSKRLEELVEIRDGYKRTITRDEAWKVEENLRIAVGIATNTLVTLKLNKGEKLSTKERFGEKGSKNSQTEPYSEYGQMKVDFEYDLDKETPKESKKIKNFRIEKKVDYWAEFQIQMENDCRERPDERGAHDVTNPKVIKLLGIKPHSSNKIIQWRIVTNGAVRIIKCENQLYWCRGVTHIFERANESEPFVVFKRIGKGEFVRVSGKLSMPDQN